MRFFGRIVTWHPVGRQRVGERTERRQPGPDNRWMRLDLRDGWVGKFAGAHGWIDRMAENQTLYR